MILDRVIILCLATTLSVTKSVSSSSRVAQTTNALVLGGMTYNVDDTSIEMLTPDTGCTPDIPPLKEGKWAARSVFYHDKICLLYTSAAADE